jgi:hypothetical protein
VVEVEARSDILRVQPLNVDSRIQLPLDPVAFAPEKVNIRLFVFREALELLQVHNEIILGALKCETVLFLVKVRVMWQDMYWRTEVSQVVVKYAM